MSPILSGPLTRLWIDVCDFANFCMNRAFIKPTVLHLNPLIVLKYMPFLSPKSLISPERLIAFYRRLSPSLRENKNVAYEVIEDYNNYVLYSRRGRRKN